ncbi:importin-5 [Tanacetum coccineum]
MLFLFGGRWGVIVRFGGIVMAICGGGGLVAGAIMEKKVKDTLLIRVEIEDDVNCVAGDNHLLKEAAMLILVNLLDQSPNVGTRLEMLLEQLIGKPLVIVLKTSLKPTNIEIRVSATSAILLKKLLEESLAKQFHQVKHILLSRVEIEDDGNVMKSLCRTITKALIVFGGENGWPELFTYIRDFLEHPTNAKICATSAILLKELLEEPLVFLSLLMALLTVFLSWRGTYLSISLVFQKVKYIRKKVRPPIFTTKHSESVRNPKGILLRRVKIEDDGNVMKSLCRMIAKAFTVFGGENGWPELFTYIRDFLENPTNAEIRAHVSNSVKKTVRRAIN